MPSSTIRGPVSLHDAEACGTNDVVLLAEGGAICSHALNGTYHPSSAVVRRLCEDALHGSRCTSEVSIIVPDQGLVLSDDVTLDRIESFGQTLQMIVQKMRARNVVVLAGSHKVPRYATAAMLALTPGDLGVGTNDQTSLDMSGSLVLASTRHATNVDPAAAVGTLRNALDLTKHLGMQGRASALFGDHLYALPGLSRPEDPTALQSRYPLRGRKDGQRGAWYFAEHMDYDVPIGNGEVFDLQKNVRTYVFGGESEHDPDAMLNALWGDVKTNDVRGLVIKRAGFRHPFIACDREKLDSIDAIGIPVIAVGERDGESVKPPNGSHEYNYLLDGSNLYSGEAKLLLAHWLKGAEHVGCQEKQDIIAYVRQKLDSYPFR